MIDSRTVLLLELEAGLAGGLGEGADAPVVEVAVAVEDDLVDALRLAAASAIASPTFFGRVGLVVARSSGALDVLRRGSRRARASCPRRRRRPARRCACALRKTREARALGGPADLLADAELAALAARRSASPWSSRRLTCRPCRPCPPSRGPSRPGSERPCRRTAPADGSRGSSRRSGPSSPCRRR